MKNTNPMPTRKKNLLVMALLMLVAVGFYFLTLIRMGEQSTQDRHDSPVATPSNR